MITTLMLQRAKQKNDRRLAEIEEESKRIKKRSYLLNRWIVNAESIDELEKECPGRLRNINPTWDTYSLSAGCSKSVQDLGEYFRKHQEPYLTENMRKISRFLSDFEIRVRNRALTQEQYKFLQKTSLGDLYKHITGEEMK